MTFDGLHMADMPLFVDLDGTLVRTDIAQEQLAASMLMPVSLWRAMGTSRSIAGLKHAAARTAPVDASTLPYTPAVLEHIAQARAAGRKVVLATAADQQVAQAVADHLGLFDDILASTPERNLKGAAKLQAIRDWAKGAPFEYLGDSKADVPIWAEAARCGYVNTPARLRGNAPVSLDVTREGNRARALLKAMRPHQWAKNVLLFVPLFFTPAAFGLGSIATVLMAMLAFSFCASSAYLLNDVVDIASDRQHRTKRKRPFAAGRLKPIEGVAAGIGLILLSFAMSLLITPLFTVVLGAYFVLTVTYSFVLKRFSTVDVVALAVLYTMRILAGAAAIAVVPSHWLLSFSLFFFLSLAYMKRFIELDRVSGDGKLPSRNYSASDLQLVQIFGIANGALAILTLAQYVTSEAVAERYTSPAVLWLMVPLMMFWIYRIWTWASRGQVDDDPVVFALRDRMSLITGGILVVIVASAHLFDLSGIAP